MDTALFERIKDEVGDLVADLMHTHRKEIAETWMGTEDNKLNISFSASLSGAATAPLISVKMSFAKKFSDEASRQLDDANQAQLPLNGSEDEEAE
jgi:hypothetical protein